MKLVETYNFMSNLPHRTLVKEILIPSGHHSGFTKAGFVAWKFDGINATTQEVFGNSPKEAIFNLEEFLKQN